MTDCIFCKIVSGDIPSHKILENDHILAFLDIAPVSKGHSLVIPKKHFSNLEDIPDEELCELIKAVKKVGASIKNNLKVPGYNVSENNDPVAGQIISHIHFHLIPRIENDGLELWSQGKYNEGEAESISKKLKIN